MIEEWVIRLIILCCMYRVVEELRGNWLESRLERLEREFDKRYR